MYQRTDLSTLRALMLIITTNVHLEFTLLPEALRLIYIISFNLHMKSLMYILLYIITFYK